MIYSTSIERNVKALGTLGLMQQTCGRSLVCRGQDFRYVGGAKFLSNNIENQFTTLFAYRQRTSCQFEPHESPGSCRERMFSADVPTG